jgi:hypothetical protein
MQGSPDSDLVGQLAKDRVVDGLTVFSSVWACASIFSLVDNPSALLLREGWALFAILWACIIAALALLTRPRDMRILGFLGAALAVRYIYLLPVASNNKTIAAFMNFAIVVVLLELWINHKRAEDPRETAYERMRVAARGLLAVMYFFGIFHKINTDFFDPRVSCAVALYEPLASGFGLSDNIYGRYLAIWATFIIETITLVALYWRRYFAIGLFVGLIFHFIIPLSGYSWYMDFSSLVLALYILSIPSPVSTRAFVITADVLSALRAKLGLPVRMEACGKPAALAILICAATVMVVALGVAYENSKLEHLYRSVWMLMWTIYGGIAMIVLVYVAADHLPYKGAIANRQSPWIYCFPALLFIMSLSPYAGLKTESSIAMFSNLHTEGGQSNHLLFRTPPYLFGYQQDIVDIVDSSNPGIRKLAATNQAMVLFQVKEFLRKHPDDWISYRRGSEVFAHQSASSFSPQEHASLIERKLLLFKPVDYARPKVCTH